MILGISLFIISLIINISPVITGNVISQNYSIIPLNFLSWIFMVFSCLLIIISVSSKDILQKKLEEMERNNPSASRNATEKSSFLHWLKEKIHFMGRKTSEIKQNSEKYAKEKIYAEGTKLPSGKEIDNELIRRKELINEEKKYLESRKDVYATISALKNPPATEEEINKIYRSEERIFPNNLDRKIDRMKEYLKKSGGNPESIKRYEELLERRRYNFYSPVKNKAEQELEDMVTGKQGRISHEKIFSKIRAKLRFSGESEPTKRQIEEAGAKYIQNNLDKIPYVPIEKMKEQGITLVSGIPGHLGDPRIVGLDQSRLQTNNESGYFSLNRGFIGIEDLASKIIDEKPPLSAISVSRITDERKFFSPWGVMLGGEGKIYDAEDSDLQTTPYGNSKIRLARYRGETNVSIEQRVNRAVNYSKSNSSGATNSHDEFSVGGDYSVTGIYFIESKLSPEEVSQVVNFAREKGIRAYAFRKGEFISHEEIVKEKERERKKEKPKDPINPL